MQTEMTIWKRVDSILEQKGLTLNQLTTMAGLNYGTTKGQRCKRDLNKIDDAVRIANALDVSLDYLITGKEAGAFSDEAIAVEYDDKLKAVVRACVANPHLLEVISTTVICMEESATRKQG